MNDQFYLNGDTLVVAKHPSLLLNTLRDELHLTGTKAACREGDCGSCQVLIKFPGKHSWSSFTSCLLRTQDLIGAHVLTVEALPDKNPLISILSAAGVSQCGFCSPGLLISVIHWLLNGKALTEEEGAREINSNLCRCTGYMGQRRAIKALCQQYQEDLLACTDRVSYLINANILPACISTKIEPLEQSECDAKASAKVIAGGTDLYLENPIEQVNGASLQPRENSPAALVRNEQISLSAKHSIQEIEDELNRLGCLPSFKHFADCFASTLIRRRATLGGNLAHGSPVGDGITYLLALEAELETNKRCIPIKDFYTGFKQTCLQADEVVEWINVPKPPEISVVLFEKVGRRQTCDIAVVNCCGVWVIEQGKVSKVSLVMGGASASPVRLNNVESMLTGQPLEMDIPQEVFDLLQSSISPISDLRGTEDYRRLLAQQLLVSQWHALSLSPAKAWQPNE